MPKFTDRHGKEWEVNLDVGLIEDIKEKLEIDLDDLIKEKSNLVELIFGSPRKMVEIMYVMCEDQIKQIPLTPRDFGRRFDRETIDKASEAFLQAIMLFYPRTSAGKVLAEQFPQILAKMDQAIEAKTRKEITSTLDRVFSDYATDTRESAG